jgi:hypothetical protein
MANCIWKMDCTGQFVPLCKVGPHFTRELSITLRLKVARLRELCEGNL